MTCVLNATDLLNNEHKMNALRSFTGAFYKVLDSMFIEQ